MNFFDLKNFDMFSLISKLCVFHYAQSFFLSFSIPSCMTLNELKCFLGTEYCLFCSWLLYLFPRTVITKYTKLSSLKEQNLFYHISRIQKSKIKVSAGPHSLGKGSGVESIHIFYLPSLVTSNIWHFLACSYIMSIFASILT